MTSEELKDRKHIYYMKSREKWLAYAKEKYLENPRADYQKNSPAAKRARQRYYQKNKETFYEHTKKYRSTYRGRLMILMAGAKKRAQKADMMFDLDIDFLMSQPKICPVFGIEFDISNGSSRLSSVSLDRVNNTKGYTKDNVRLISMKANRMKSDGKIEDFERIIQYMKESL